MKIRDCQRTDQTFTHIDTDFDGKVRHFNTTALAEWALCTGQEVHEIEVEADKAEWISKNHGVEQAKLTAITATTLNDPILFACWPDGTHLLIDGNHRYVAAAALGRKSLPAYFIEPKNWEGFLVEDVLPALEAVLVGTVKASLCR